MPLPLLALAAPGLIKAAGSLFGGGARRREQAAAAKAQKVAEADLKGHKFSQATNPFADVTNTSKGNTNAFLNQRVATGSAEFQAENTSQNIANVADAIRQGGGGGSGGAASLAQQAAQSQARIGANLQQQEQGIQQNIAQGEQRRQEQLSAGESRKQQLFGQGNQYAQSLRNKNEGANRDRLSFFLGRADKRKGAADKARSDATKALVGGLSSAAGAFAGGAFGGAAGAAGSGASGIVGSLGDSTFSAGGYNAASSFLSKTQFP